MKTATAFLLASLTLSSAQSFESVHYRQGLGTPVSDHQLLAVAHLGLDVGSSVRDPMSNLAIVNYASGTFLSWATIAYDWPEIGDSVSIAVQRDGITYECQEIESILFNRYLVTDPLLVAGDSGGGVFDRAGNLVGVNYGYNSANRDSYHLSTAASADWLRENIAVVPEPSITWLVTLAAVVWFIANRNRKT